MSDGISWFYDNASDLKGWKVKEEKGEYIIRKGSDFTVSYATTGTGLYKTFNEAKTGLLDFLDHKIDWLLEDIQELKKQKKKIKGLKE